MPNTGNGGYPTSQHDERTITYLERTIRIRKKISEVVDNDFPITSPGCNSVTIQGDGSCLPLDGSPNLDES